MLSPETTPLLRIRLAHNSVPPDVACRCHLGGLIGIYTHDFGESPLSASVRAWPLLAELERRRRYAICAAYWTNFQDKFVYHSMLEARPSVKSKGSKAASRLANCR